MSSTPNILEMLGCFSREKRNISINPKKNEPPDHAFDRKNSILRPLTSQFFINLLDLEEKFSQKQVSMDLISNLTNIYIKLIELYDEKQDPIVLYFNEKLEALHSNYLTLRCLRKNRQNNPKSSCSQFSKQNKKPDSLQEKLYSGFEVGIIYSQPIFNDMSDEENIQDTRKKAKSIVQKRNERQTKAKIVMGLEKKKDAEIEKTSKLLLNFIEKSNENDDIVKNDLKKQMKGIFDKINRKRLILANNGSSFLDSRFGSLLSYGDSKEIIEGESVHKDTYHDLTCYSAI